MLLDSHFIIPGTFWDVQNPNRNRPATSDVYKWHWVAIGHGQELGFPLRLQKSPLGALDCRAARLGILVPVRP